MLQEMDEEDEDPSPAPDYTQELRRILGNDTAEYFLNPPPMDFQISPSLQRILDTMEDPLGAEQLWRILQEMSQKRLQEGHGDVSRTDQTSLLRDFAQRPVMRRVTKKRQNLLFIRQISQLHEDIATLQLANGPLPDMNDSRGQEGHTRYLCAPREKEC
ncbi:uncharacterized protein O3C94_013776 [Discoglossus pictus]